MPDTTTAILVNVYRDQLGDCTNGGVSSEHDTLWLECHEQGCTQVKTDDPRLVRLEKNAFGTCVIVPANPTKRGIRMMGGNYAATSDSRFRRMVEEMLGHNFYGAVPIHDRFESQEMYDRLSR